MPGDHRSIKNEDVYEALRRKGYSEEKSARIANATANHTIDHHKGHTRTANKSIKGK